MAYQVVSPSHYPFRRENSKFFSQELIENVLFDFGCIWKPVRSEREIKLRKVASFVFLPSIGRLVAYISRKYSGFIVMKCLKSWNYINSHRPTVKERLLCNDIVTICTRHELNDDLALFTFLAIVVEYARLAITHDQEILVDTAVDALSYCLSNVLPGGFVCVLEKLKKRALNFDYPRNCVVCDYNPQTRFLSPVNTEPMYTPKSEFESPIMLEFYSPVNICDKYSEYVMTELRNRKIHRELFRRKMMTDRTTQTDIKSDHSFNQLRSVVFRFEESDLAEKIEIKNNSDSQIPEATLMVVETSDVSVQTWSSGEQFEKLHTESDKAEAREMSKGACPTRNYALDLNAVIKKLKALERLQVKGPLIDRSPLVTTDVEYQNSKDKKEKIEAKKLNITLSTESVIPLKLEVNTDKQNIFSAETVLQDSGITHEKDLNIEQSFNDSQFESLDLSANDPTKLKHEHYSKKDCSFESQIGSSNENVKASEDSRLEN